jgi:predicted GNAT family acetyltransferase
MKMTGPHQFAVRHNVASRSYEVTADAEVVGTLAYGNAADRIVVLHTRVAPRYRGRGVASRLVEAALTDARLDGRTVTDYCGFVSSFVGRHPEYADLMDAERPGAGHWRASSATPAPLARS